MKFMVITSRVSKEHDGLGEDDIVYFPKVERIETFADRESLARYLHDLLSTDDVKENEDYLPESTVWELIDGKYVARVFTLKFDVELS